MEVSGKVALITGGGTGIGRATALLLARRGADVAVNYSRSKADAEATAAEIIKLGRRAISVRADVASDEEVVRMVETVVRELGRLDILVNSAGFTEFIDFRDLARVTPAIWERTMAVNVQGPFHCIRAAEPHMRRVGAGAVVNVSSMAGRLARGSSIPYCASKAALDIVTRSLARVLAPVIRVNGVAPGVVKTRWMDRQPALVRAAQMHTPMRRVAQPEDVAEIIVALIADNDFVTGQTIPVDGGFSV
jgi:3-oxoacyl-[acyl-carrier protein] reductase